MICTLIIICLLFIAWIGSLASFLCFFASPVAGRLAEKLNCRYVTMIGAVSSAVGLLLSSFANRLIVYFFTYSLLVGFGSSCIRTSSFLVVAQYFHKRKPFATGILSAGAGLGLFVLAPVIRAFLNSVGLDNTFRFLAGILFVGGIPALLYDPSVVEDGSEPHDSSLQLEEAEDSQPRGPTKIVDSASIYCLCSGVYDEFLRSIYPSYSPGKYSIFLSLL